MRASFFQWLDRASGWTSAELPAASFGASDVLPVAAGSSWASWSQARGFKQKAFYRAEPLSCTKDHRHHHCPRRLDEICGLEKRLACGSRGECWLACFSGPWEASLRCRCSRGPRALPLCELNSLSQTGLFLHRRRLRLLRLRNPALRYQHLSWFWRDQASESQWLHSYSFSGESPFATVQLFHGATLICWNEAPVIFRGSDFPSVFWILSLASRPYLPITTSIPAASSFLRRL